MKPTNKIPNRRKKILFLGYGREQTILVDALEKNNCLVDHTSEKVTPVAGYDFIVSFGYRYILNQSVITQFDCPIFNLHISYLPFNRGAHPNFWSFFDNTPAGVTIHLIDDGVDTGPIVAQKYVKFKLEDDTFTKTYNTLIEEIEDLFLEHLPSFLSNKWTAKEQKGPGTHHCAKDLPSNFSGWNSNIQREISRLNTEGLKYE